MKRCYSVLKLVFYYSNLRNLIRLSHKCSTYKLPRFKEDFLDIHNSVIKSKDVEEEEENEVIELEKKGDDDAGAGEHVHEQEEHYEQEHIPLDQHRRCLLKSEVSVRLSFLGKTADSDGYTYLKATLTRMGLTHIDAITCFKHLQFLDVSENNLCVPELQIVSELPYLVLLHADKNKLDSAKLRRMPYLQVLILNHNNIKTVNEIYQPELSTIELGFNKIQKLCFNHSMPNIRCLDFRNNSITEIADLNFPKLDSLYLGNNKIVSLVGIEKLVNLRILHLRNNPIRLLDGFHEDQKKLIYLNLRNCRVSTLKQIKKLKVLKGLETIILKGTPFMGGTGEEGGGGGGEEDDNELRVEILATLPILKRINKATVSPEEREEAKAMMLQWLEEGEKEEEEIEDEVLLEEASLL